jgi:hydrogenase nickel incorporation protein HypA/HybF
MHELGVTQQVLDIALNHASEAKATAIKRINLVIGDMSSFLNDSVQFYFDFLSKDSIAEGAQLCFRRIPITLRCKHCNASFTPEGETWNCPQCKHSDIEIITGREFYLESIEVE